MPPHLELVDCPKVCEWVWHMKRQTYGIVTEVGGAFADMEAAIEDEMAAELWVGAGPLPNQHYVCFPSLGWTEKSIKALPRIVDPMPMLPLLMEHVAAFRSKSTEKWHMLGRRWMERDRDREAWRLSEALGAWGAKELSESPELDQCFWPGDNRSTHRCPITEVIRKALEGRKAKRS